MSWYQIGWLACSGHKRGIKWAWKNPPTAKADVDDFMRGYVHATFDTDEQGRLD